MLPVSITQEQVSNSPHIDTRKPVSRQHEMHYLGYYGYPFYWDGFSKWSDLNYPNVITQEAADDYHLRSFKVVKGYHIKAMDGDIGHVDGLIIDESWVIRYMIVNTGHWWHGHQVLIAPQWINSVDWPESIVSVGLSKQEVKDAPTYKSTALLDRAQEISIHEHYGRPVYWKTKLHSSIGRAVKAKKKLTKKVTKVIKTD